MIFMKPMDAQYIPLNTVFDPKIRGACGLQPLKSGHHDEDTYIEVPIGLSGMESTGRGQMDPQ